MAENDTDKSYWAGRATPEMLKVAWKKIDRWFDHIKTNGQLALWRKSLHEYYAGEETGGSVGTAGEQDEMVTMKVNHLHSIGEHVVTAVAGQAPAFQPQAQNNDHEATSQTDIARVILEACVAQKGLSEVFVQTTRRAWVLKEGYGAAEWDERMGEDYAALGKQITKTGDVRLRTYTPENVPRDHLREGGLDHEWYFLRRWENKHNVLARALVNVKEPEKIQSITANVLGQPTKAEENEDRPRLEQFGQNEESDEIAVWEFRHAKTDALPGGRRTVFVSPEVWLSDGDLPYRGLYVFRMVPEERIGREGGYTPHFDLLAPQHGVNAAYSSQLSALAALGHPVVHAQTNSNVTVEELKAFSLLKSQGEVKSLNLLTPDALKPHKEFAADMVAQMEIESGVNAVRRGNASSMGASSSGAKLALVDAKFYESIVGIQRSFKDFASAVATAIVQLYRDFGKVEQTVAVAGKDKRVHAKKFIGARDLKGVLRVDIEMGDPMSRTAAGRMEIATMLLGATGADGKPVIKTPEQILQVIQTGRLDPLTSGQQSELDNIKAENEMLGDGKTPQVFVFDNHPLHLQEHYAVVASPEARTSPIVPAVMEHMANHLKEWQGAPLDGLMARQIPPAPSASMMPPPAPGEPSGTGAPAPGESSSSEPAPSDAGPGGPSLPQQPVNPATGERAPAPPMV